jgi:hypothetical protein
MRSKSGPLLGDGKVSRILTPTGDWEMRGELERKLQWDTKSVRERRGWGKPKEEREGGREERRKAKQNGNVIWPKYAS